MTILDELATHFDNEKDFIQSTIFLSKHDFIQILNLFKGTTKAHNELIKLVIETLTYKLGIEFDNMKLERQEYPYLNKETNMRELLIPLVLTLTKNEKPVLIIDGGTTGTVIYDLALLFDKLLMMNNIQFSGRPIIDFSLLVNVGIKC